MKKPLYSKPIQITIENTNPEETVVTLFGTSDSPIKIDLPTAMAIALKNDYDPSLIKKWEIDGTTEIEITEELYQQIMEESDLVWDEELKMYIRK